MCLHRDIKQIFEETHEWQCTQVASAKQCTRCEKSFVTESILEIHIERAHKNKSADATKSGESWACNYCTEIFPTCSLVQAHTLKAHKKKYHCKDPLLLEYECVLYRNKFRKNKYPRNYQENVHKEDRKFLLSGIHLKQLDLSDNRISFLEPQIFVVSEEILGKRAKLLELTNICTLLRRWFDQGCNPKVILPHYNFFVSTIGGTLWLVDSSKIVFD